MQRSRGFRSKSRRKMTKVVREGRSNPITNKLQKFEEGDLVHITIPKRSTTSKVPWKNW